MAGLLENNIVHELQPGMPTWTKASLHHHFQPSKKSSYPDPKRDLPPEFWLRSRKSDESSLPPDFWLRSRKMDTETKPEDFWLRSAFPKRSDGELPPEFWLRSRKGGPELPPDFWLRSRKSEDKGQLPPEFWLRSRKSDKAVEDDNSGHWARDRKDDFWLRSKKSGNRFHSSKYFMNKSNPAEKFVFGDQHSNDFLAVYDKAIENMLDRFNAHRGFKPNTMFSRFKDLEPNFQQ